MKKFTKLFLSCAAVAALTAAVATSAMAADSMRGQITGTYDAGTLTLTAPNAADEFKTVVVLDAADVAADPNTVQIKSKNVIGIDQVTESEIVVKLDTTKVDTANKEYTVLIGGSAGQIYEGTFGKVSGVTFKIGDINISGKIDLTDGTMLLRHIAELDRTGKAGVTTSATVDGNAVTIGDINVNGKIDLTDSTMLLRYIAELDRTGKAGVEVTGAINE